LGDLAIGRFDDLTNESEDFLSGIWIEEFGFNPERIKFE
jgi:hypothetical protein